MDLNVNTLATKVGIPTELASEWLESNPSKELPYHGNNHALEVAAYSQKLADLLGLSSKATTHLTAAGLLHDYNHTGDRTASDTININRALSYVKEHKETLEENGLDVKQLTILIKATLRPTPKAPPTLNARVLADADLMFWVDPETTITQMRARMDALAAEQGVSVTVESTHEFIKNSKFLTTPAWNFQRQSIWNNSLEVVVQKFQNDLSTQQ